MRRGRIRVETARDAMLELRAALLSASGLDERTEPVPLLVADPVAATISLARVHGRPAATGGPDDGDVARGHRPACTGARVRLSDGEERPLTGG